MRVPSLTLGTMRAECLGVDKQNIIALIVITLAGCTAQLGDPEFQGHGAQEMRVSLEDIDASWRAEGDWLVSPVLAAPDGASRVGLLLGTMEPANMPTVQARPLAGSVPVGEWVDVAETWGEEDQFVGIAELGTTADGAQLRIARADVPRVRNFRWNAVIPDLVIDEPLLEDQGDLGAAREGLRSELTALGVVTRESWGARRGRCSSRNASKTRMAIHYTVTNSNNPARQVRGIQRYHMDSRGWCDIAYHFLVGIDGTVYEGRPLELLGSHVRGNNTGNIGIAFIGCFHPSGCSRLGTTTPSEVSIQSAGRLVGELSRIYGIEVNGVRVKGHRDHSGASTSCPGDYLYSRLEDLRSIARDGSAAPAPTPAPSPAPAPSPTPGGASCGHTYGGTYADTACSAGYQCCDGRWRVRGSSSSCGGCLCVEESGRTGCASSDSAPSPSPAPAPAPTPSAPAGASCGHTYGGTYGNTACSAGYQCCDGRWRVRGSSRACGACFCTEATGRTGCGAD